MKKVLLSFLIFLVTPSLFAQQSRIDSLAAELKAAKNELQRLPFLKQLASANYPEKDLPAVIAYCKQGVATAKKMERPKEEEYYLQTLARAYNQSYNYPKSLEVGFEGIELSEKIKDDAFTARFLNSVFVTMNDRSSNDQEIHKALNYGLKGLHIAQRIGDKQLVGRLSFNIGSQFREMSKPMLDSAIYYMQQSYQMAIATNDVEAGYSIAGLGTIQDRLHHTELAFSYYRLSVPYFKRSNNYRRVCGVYTAMAELYRKNDQPDSALYYANIGYQLAKEHNIQASLNLTASLLSKLYQGKNELESLRYYKIANIAREGVDNAEKIKQFQIVSFNEQQREQEIAEQQLKDKEERKQTLQLFAIGLFIPCFLVTVFLLNRTRVHRGLIDFMGVLSLLLLFEFITLLIHPRVVELTHHTPVLELLILVGLAAILVPLHHRSTHWLKGKLSAKQPTVVKESKEEE